MKKLTIFAKGPCGEKKLFDNDGMGYSQDAANAILKNQKRLACWKAWQFSLGEL